MRALARVGGRTALSPTAAPVTLMEASGFAAARAKEDEGWRAMSGQGTNRDLPGSSHDRMLDLSFQLFRRNPTASRLIKMELDFILGTGIKITSDDEATQQVLTDWWEDPRNNWPQQSPQRFRDLLIYGEWLHIPVLGPSGRTWVNVIQPDKIKAIKPSDESHEILETVILKEAFNANGELQRDFPLSVIQPQYNARGEFKGYAGDCMYFGLNRTTDTTRGVGELFPLIDYLDIYDEMIYNRAERVRNSSAMWWDLQVEGAQQEEIERFVTKETDLPPRPGTVWAHNERMQLKAVTADLKSDDHAQDAELLRSVIVASAGFPGIFFDAPGSAGRAVAQEMSEPTMRAMLSLQDQMREFLKTWMDFVLWRAVEAHVIDKAEPYHISFPRPTTRDMQRTGPAVFRLAQAIDGMLGRGVMTPEQAVALWSSQINQLGLSDRPFDMSAVKDAQSRFDAATKLAKQPQLRLKPQPPQAQNGNEPKPSGSGESEPSDG